MRYPNLDRPSGPAVIAALRAEGVIKIFSKELSSLLDVNGVAEQQGMPTPSQQRAELPAGSKHERALRAAAVVAADAVAQVCLFPP